MNALINYHNTLMTEMIMNKWKNTNKSDMFVIFWNGT
jgi:hypothetical protein